MTAALVAALALAQGYERLKVDLTAGAACLWWPEGSELVWRMSEPGATETPGDTELTATRRAFDTWQQVLARCGSLRLKEGPRSDVRRAEYNRAPGAANDNLVIFRERRCTPPPGDPCQAQGECGNKFDCWGHSLGAIAITTTSYNPTTGRVLDADVELNAVAFILSTVDSPACPSARFDYDCVATDIQNTMTHEVGHLLGLAHSPGSASTMNARADPGELSKRQLDPGSQQFVCDVYPALGLARQCRLAPVDLLPDGGAPARPAGGLAQVQVGREPSCGCQGVAPGGPAALVAWLLVGRRRRSR